MAKTPRPIGHQLVRELVAAGHEALDALCDSINLELAVGNDDFDDVQSLREARDRLSAAIDKMEQAGFS